MAGVAIRPRLVASTLVPVLVAVLASVLAGCRVDTSVEISLREDGRGTVTARVELDAAAVERLEGIGAPIEEAVVLDDLAAAGWRVEPWVRADDGGATLELHHDFAGEAELRRRLEELAGPAVGDVTLVRERGLLRSRDEVSVEVDLRAAGSTVGDDAALRESLAAAGVDVDALAAELDAEVRDALTAEVVVDGPGGADASARLAAGDREVLVAQRSSFDTGRAAVLLVAAGGVVLALLLLGLARGSARRSRRRAGVAARR